MCILTKLCDEVYILSFNGCVKFHARIAEVPAKVGGLLFIGPLCIIVTVREKLKQCPDSCIC